MYVIFNSSVHVYQRVTRENEWTWWFSMLPSGKLTYLWKDPPFSYRFPVVFRWFSYGFPDDNSPLLPRWGRHVCLCSSCAKVTSSTWSGDSAGQGISHVRVENPCKHTLFHPYIHDILYVCTLYIYIYMHDIYIYIEDTNIPTYLQTWHWIL